MQNERDKEQIKFYIMMFQQGCYSDYSVYFVKCNKNEYETIMKLKSKIGDFEFDEFYTLNNEGIYDKRISYDYDYYGLIYCSEYIKNESFYCSRNFDKYEIKNKELITEIILQYLSILEYKKRKVKKMRIHSLTIGEARDLLQGIKENMQVFFATPIFDNHYNKRKVYIHINNINHELQELLDLISDDIFFFKF